MSMEAPAFPQPGEGAEMLRVDPAAGIPHHDGLGRVVDFHAPRHSFITGVVRSDADPRVAQVLARHSDVKLTLGTYAHADRVDLRKALGESDSKQS